MTNIKKWYAVHTKPRWEKKVASLFDKINIANYCPLNRVVRQWTDRKKVIHEPLFKSYVFVHISDNEQSRVRLVHGVINFVCWLGKPAVIRDAEIEVIQQFLKDYKNVQIEESSINMNDVVRIVRGPLLEQEGTVIQVMNNRVKVRLPSLGCVMSAEIEKSDIELVYPSKEG
jgi:transcription antitermination factor NusG